MEAPDLLAVKELAETGLLSLDGLITHHADGRRTPTRPTAPPSATTDCLKMVLDWRGLRMSNLPERPRPRSSSCATSACAPRPRSSPTRCPPRRSPRTTQIIAIYGKGGIGKSFTLANLSYMMAQQGKKVLLIGCDPKSDTTSLLFGGKACPTIIETSSEEEAGRRERGHRRRLLQARRRLRDGTRRPRGRPRLRRARHHPRLRDAGEARLPRLGLRLRAARLPGRRGLRRLRPADRARHVPEGHRRRQQRPAVAVRRQQRLQRGRVLPQARRQRRRGRHGDQQGRRHRRGQAFAANAGIPVLATIPANEDIRRKSASYEIIGRPGTPWAPLFEELATNVADAPPVRPKPQTQDQLLGLFSAEVTGRDFKMEPATLFDMVGKTRSSSRRSKSSTTPPEAMSSRPPSPIPPVNPR
jgi:chlorophyllide a reductase subunit X